MGWKALQWYTYDISGLAVTDNYCWVSGFQSSSLHPVVAGVDITWTTCQMSLQYSVESIFHHCLLFEVSFSFYPTQVPFQLQYTDCQSLSKLFSMWTSPGTIVLIPSYPSSSFLAHTQEFLPPFLSDAGSIIWKFCLNLEHYTPFTWALWKALFLQNPSISNGCSYVTQCQ